jgi:Fic family protein
MFFQPRFHYSHAAVSHLGKIEAARAVIEVLPLPPDQALFLRQAARQRATRNSTAIEGNKLNTMEIRRAVVATGKSDSEMQQEVRNYWRALEWVEQQLEARRQITEDFIKELHCIIVVRGRGRRGQKSDYRTEECPVVDAETNSIDYAPPRPGDIEDLMKGMMRWLQVEEAKELPGPVRAGLLAHRFVSIHPFNDGNGRTARALATAELWRSGYDMRGFLSLEEHYTADLHAYYHSLQMGLPVDFYEGRNDPDHTPWLNYFLRTMAAAANSLKEQAVKLFDPDHRPTPPWDGLNRTQQQLLTRLLVRALSEKKEALTFSPGDVVEWYGVSPATSREWLEKWKDDGFVMPEKADVQRVRAYRLTERWESLLQTAIHSNSDKNS